MTRMLKNVFLIFIFFSFLSITSFASNNDPALDNASHYGFLTFLPPLTAIILAFMTKNVILSLFIGTFVGCFMIHLRSENIFISMGHALIKLCNDTITSMADFGNAGIILQVLTIGGVIALMNKMGGIKGIARVISKLARTPRSAQFSTWLLSLCIFFDDYANALTVGPMMRPITDKLRVSREKLAFIIDATAAPLAGMALISTWVAYEVKLIKDSLLDIGLDYNAYGLFVSSLPFRFYNLFIFAAIFFTILFLREFGPMYKAEARSRLTGETFRKGSFVDEIEESDTGSSPWFAIIPILTLILSAFVRFYFDGKANILEAGNINLIKYFDTFSFQSLQIAFGATDASKVLFQAAMISAIVSFIIGKVTNKFSIAEGVEVFLSGIKSMNITAVILLAAWALSIQIKELGTATYLVQKISHTMPQWSVPAIIFVLAALMSFSTGASYGTMGILMPLAIPLSWAILPDVDYLVLNISAVLTGAIFGDHCSPISDSTILSAMGSSCSLIDHAKTQLIYAFLVSLVAIAAYVMAGLKINVFIIIISGIIMTALIFRLLGKKLPNLPEDVSSNNL